MTKWYDKEFEIKLPKLTQKQKRILWVVAAVALVLIALYVRYADAIDQNRYLNLSGFHMHDSAYQDALGIRKIKYEAFIEQYGEPERVELLPGDETNIDHYTACYPGVSCTYVVAELWPAKYPGVLSPHLTQITVTDARYRFGRSKTGVGSTREAVHRAYRWSKPVSAEELQYNARDFPNVEEGYYGDYWCRILFRYDENDCVDAMAYVRPYN